jgi:hypothetical protein
MANPSWVKPVAGNPSGHLIAGCRYRLPARVRRHALKRPNDAIELGLGH